MWKLGILRNLGGLVGNLVESLAKGGNSLFGTAENALIGINERLLHMSRRVRADLYPPGYVRNRWLQSGVSGRVLLVFGARCDAGRVYAMLVTHPTLHPFSDNVTCGLVVESVVVFMHFISLRRYLVPSGVTQPTLTGSDWRYAVMHFPGMVAGAVGRRPDESSAPFAGKLRRSPYGSRSFQEEERRARVVAQRLQNRKRKRSGRSPGGKNATRPRAGQWRKADESHSSAGDAESVNHRWATTDDEDVVPPADRSGVDSKAFADLFPAMSPADAVLEVMCRAAALSGKLSGDNRVEQAHQTEEEATAIASDAAEFISRYVAILFGPLHTPKAHRLASHLLAELLDRGNLTEADTSINEGLHGRCKAMYDRSNKHVSTFTAQMMRSEQTLACVLAEAATERREDVERGRALLDAAAAEFVAPGPFTEVAVDADVSVPEGREALSDDSGTSDENSVARGAALGAERAATGARHGGGGRRRSLSALRVRGSRSTVAELSTMNGGALAGLGEAVGADDDQMVYVANSLSFLATFEWGASSVQQRLYAARSNHGKPFYDFFRFTDDSSATGCSYGRALLAINGINGVARRGVVVQRLALAEKDPKCVRTRFGGTQLRWEVDETTSFPTLSFVPLDNVQRLELVEPDFASLCARHSLFATPSNTPNTVEERALQRWFVNNFYSWTSAKLKEL